MNAPRRIHPRQRQLPGVTTWGVRKPASVGGVNYLRGSVPCFYLIRACYSTAGKRSSVGPRQPRVNTAFRSLARYFRHGFVTVIVRPSVRDSQFSQPQQSHLTKRRERLQESAARTKRRHGQTRQAYALALSAFPRDEHAFASSQIGQAAAEEWIALRRNTVEISPAHERRHDTLVSSASRRQSLQAVQRRRFVSSRS